MIPEFDRRGYLPPGVHEADWEEFQTNAHRKALVAKMTALIDHLKAVGCKSLFIDGSFVTGKEMPNDYDACWDVTGVKFESVDPLLLDGSDEGKSGIEAKYGGDIRPDKFSPLESDATYFEFFQIDRNGEPKGIIQLVLTEFSLDQE